MKNWIYVYTKKQADECIKFGFLQATSRKKSFLQKLSLGDEVILYCGSEDIGKKSSIQSFLAIGKVTENSLYEFFPDFVSFKKDGEVFMKKTQEPFFRIKMEFYLQAEVKIKPIIEDLEFIKNKEKWGVTFLNYQIQISEKDFLLVKKLMQN